MSQTNHGILLHVIFSTKFRKPLLDDSWRNDLLAYMGGTAKEHKAVILKAGGVEDHVHLLLRIHPSFSVSGTVRMLKANSSKWINEGGKIQKRFEWQRGYGVFSVSQSMADTVKAYIENQRQHHQKINFQDEYMLILKRHRVAFELKYVFDKEIVS